MEVLIRHCLAVEPAGDLEGLIEQYAAALWIEERRMAMMTAAVAKAFGAKG